MLKRALPDWNDEVGMAKLADEIVARHERHTKNLIAYGEEVLDVTPFLDDDGNLLDDNGVALEIEITRFQRAERAAVAAVRRGDTAQLAKLTLHENWDWMDTRTREIIARHLTSEKQRKRGQRKRGRPKMTPEQRFASNPIHEAAVTMQMIRRELRRLYPEQAAAAVRERATTLAANQIGVEAEALRLHCNRSRRDRHRL